jgi:hypothetical protein
MLISLNCGVIVAKFGFERLSGMGVWLIDPADIVHSPLCSRVCLFPPPASLVISTTTQSSFDLYKMS